MRGAFQPTKKSKRSSQNIAHEGHFTDEATRSLDGVLAFIASNYPAILAEFEKRLRTVLTRIGVWPESAREVAQRRGVRVASLTPYLYKIFYIFYQVTAEAVEVLYIWPRIAAGALATGMTVGLPFTPIAAATFFDSPSELR